MNGEQKELLKKFDEAMYGKSEEKEENGETTEKKKGRFGKKKNK